VEAAAGEDEDIAEATMSSSCSVVKAELVECLKKSACMVSDGQTFQYCLKAQAGEIGPECTALRSLYHECKRAQIDRRYRLKGNPAFGRLPNEKPDALKDDDAR
jgi:cytochrome c oxidase assembly factor 5